MIRALPPSYRRALEILRDHGPQKPREFAKLFWPDSPAWRHHVKCGNGSHRGGGMYMAGGGFLGRLRRLGLAKTDVASLLPGKTGISPEGLKRLAGY